MYIYKINFNLLRFLLLPLLTFIIAGISCAENNNTNDKWAVKIADSFIELHPDTVAYKTEAKSYRWNYEQGLMLYAFYQLWKQTDDDKYFSYIKKNINYYVEDDGSIKTYQMNDFNIDNVAPGRILLHLYEETKDEKYRKAADTLRKQLEIHPRTKSGGFWHKQIYPNQMWLDGLFMAEPFYSMYAVSFNEQKAFDDIANQFLQIEKNLKDEKSGLYYHGWDESKKQKWADPVTGRSPNFWGRSIGWFMMALVDVLDYFPEDHKNRNDILRILKNLSDDIIKFRDDKTKVWFQIIDAADREGNYPEASASAMITYTFAKGANKGYLDNKYFNLAKESFNGILKNLVKTEDGKIYLTNVVSVGGLGGNPYRDGSFEYYVSEPKRTNDFKGYGPFLLAAIEIEKTNKKVGLDYHFNNEWKDGKQFHYIWEDEEFSGFSELGNILMNLNSELVSVRQAPTKEILSGLDIYIIVDPDTHLETEKPNFINAESREAIAEWVNNGGTLVLLANDSINSEFKHLNLLSGEFGIHFNQDCLNKVTGKNFEVGRFNNFPDHPIFKSVKSLYLKEISSLSLTEPAEPILTNDENIIMAASEYGKGFVFAVGDPWLYNEYIDNRKLPEEYENYKAAENLFAWLLNGRK